MQKVSKCVSGSAWKQDGNLLEQKACQACGSRSVSLAEVERKAKGQARRVAEAARASACVGMASCIPVYEPAAQLGTTAGRSRVRKACHVHPGRHRVGVWVPTPGHTSMLRYMRVPIRVQVAFQLIGDAGVESARGARPRAQKQIERWVLVQRVTRLHWTCPPRN